jgi:hypothetical protein
MAFANPYSQEFLDSMADDEKWRREKGLGPGLAGDGQFPMETTPEDEIKDVQARGTKIGIVTDSRGEDGQRFTAPPAPAPESRRAWYPSWLFFGGGKRKRRTRRNKKYKKKSKKHNKKLSYKKNSKKLRRTRRRRR